MVYLLKTLTTDDKSCNCQKPITCWQLQLHLNIWQLQFHVIERIKLSSQLLLHWLNTIIYNWITITIVIDPCLLSIWTQWPAVQSLSTILLCHQSQITWINLTVLTFPRNNASEIFAEVADLQWSWTTDILTDINICIYV